MLGPPLKNVKNQMFMYNKTVQKEFFLPTLSNQSKSKANVDKLFCPNFRFPIYHKDSSIGLKRIRDKMQI